MTNIKAKIIIEFPQNTIDSANFVRISKLVRKLVIQYTGMENITIAEYEEYRRRD